MARHNSLKRGRPAVESNGGGLINSVTGRPATTTGTATPTPDAERGLAIYMLSSFRIAVHGRALNRPLGAKGKPLLKVLAAHWPRFLPREMLIESLWPGVGPSAGNTSLKVAAHSVRSVLEPDKQAGSGGAWIRFQNGTYGLDPSANVWIDAHSFQQHARQARRYEASGEFAAARREYEAADALYAGDFLEEDIYAEWTILRREELRDTYLNVVTRLAEFARARGDYPAAIAYCHRIVEMDPCREDAYRTLMQSHASMNQLARAGAWYAVCRSFLNREMAVDPSPETTQAFENLFRP